MESLFSYFELMSTLIFLTLYWQFFTSKSLMVVLVGLFYSVKWCHCNFLELGYTSWIPLKENYRLQQIYSINIYSEYRLSIPLTVYSIWNLNFLNLDPVPFCIPHIDTEAEAILLQYITAACPLVFIVVTYTWIKWYNNGYRLVVYTTRPVHQLLARFWQKFKIQPSL